MEGSVSLCFIAVSTLLLIWFLFDRNNQSKRRTPPGPWTLPVIGSLHHLVTVLPHRRMMDLSRRHGPLMLLKLGEVPTVVVSSAEAAELVLKTNDLVFASRPRSATLDVFSCGGKDIAFAPYGAYWRQMRKICVAKLLSSTQVHRMESILAEEVGINVSEKLSSLSNVVATRAVFGGKLTEQGEYLGELDKAFTLIGGFSLVDLFPSSRLVRWLSSGERDMKRSYGRIQRMLADAIEGRKAARAEAVAENDDDEDLLDLLLRMQQEDSLEFPLTTETIGTILFAYFC